MLEAHYLTGTLVLALVLALALALTPTLTLPQALTLTRSLTRRASELMQALQYRSIPLEVVSSLGLGLDLGLGYGRRLESKIDLFDQ